MAGGERERGDERGGDTTDAPRSDRDAYRGDDPDGSRWIPSSPPPGGHRNVERRTRWKRYLTLGCGTYLVAALGSTAMIVSVLFIVTFDGGVAVSLGEAGAGDGGGSTDGRTPGGSLLFLAASFTYFGTFAMAGVLASGLGAAIGYTSEPGETPVLAGGVANGAGMAVTLALPTAVLLTLGSGGDVGEYLDPMVGLVVATTVTGAAGGLVGEIADRF